LIHVLSDHQMDGAYIHSNGHRFEFTQRGRHGGLARLGMFVFIALLYSGISIMHTQVRGPVSGPNDRDFAVLARRFP